MNIQQQIEQMLANASAPTTPGTGQQKQQAVANASAQKKATLGGFDPYAATVGAQEGTGYATATQQERDFRDMSTLDLWRKYGDAAVFQRAGANSGVAADQQAGRDWNQAAADTVSGVGLGAFNGLAGIGALGAGVVSTDLGNSMSRGIESVNEAVMDNQSPALQARRRLNQAMNVNDQRDSTLQYEQDIANGDSGFWAGTKRIGRDAGSAIANAAADPATLLDGTAQAVGSLIGVGPLTRIGGAVGRKLLDKGVSSGVLTKENAQLLSKLGEQGGTAALIGGMEAGGAFQQSVNEVLAMPFDKLAANSTEFNKLVDSGMSMVEAREVLANKVGLETAAKVAPAAIAMGKFVAKFEAAPMSTASLKASLGNIGTQVLEEAGQGGVAQIAGNDSIARNADSTRTLSEGVGEQVGTGALFGGLMAGGAQAPGLAAQAAAAAGSRVMSAMPQAKAPEAETAPAPSQSPSVPTSSLVPLTTDAAQNAKAAAQLSDAQESLSVAASESIQNNPGLDEEQKAAQSYGMTLLESTFTFTDEDKAAVASSTRIPDDLKTKLSTARNLPEAFAATAEHALERTNKLDSQPMDQSYFSTVRYLDEMVERVEALAGNADISAVMEAATPGTPEAQYLASVYQSMANVQGSKLLKDQITMVRAALGKAPILEQANLDNVDEVLVRAKYAPHTLSHNSLDGVLGMDEDGQLPSPLTAAQRTRLESARALVAALGSGRITKTVDDVTRQIAFNKIEGDGFKYPSLVEHTSTITDAAVRGDTDVARNELNHLRNFAQTLINKATAVNESAGTTNRVQYNNWIPSQNKWRVSAKGLNVDLKGDKSAAFGERIHTEAALASAVFTSMAEQFPELAAGIEPVTGVPAMAPALSAALANRQSATPAPTPAPVASTATPPAPTAPVGKNAPTPTANASEGIVTGPKDAPVDTAPDKLPWEASAAPETNPVSLEETFKGLMNEVEALQKMEDANDPNIDAAAEKVMAGMEDALASLVERTRTPYAQELLDHFKTYLGEDTDNIWWFADDFHVMVTEAQEYLEEFTAQMGDLFEESSAPPTPEKVILSGKTQHVVKDQKKADKANKFIGRGSSKSSTNQYAQDFGDAANTGVYSADDVVFLSVEGNRTGRLPLDRAELKKATDAGATIITDIEADRNRPYNVGEREAAEFLAQQGYVEVKPGEWKKSKQSVDPNTPKPANKADKELGMVNAVAEKLKLPGVTSIGDNQPVPYIAKSVIDAVGQSIREGKNNLKAELNLVTALAKLVGLKHLVSTVRSRRDGEPQGGLYEHATSAIGLDDTLKGAPRIAVLLHEFGHHITYSKVAEYLGVDIETVTKMSEKELLAAFSEIAPGVSKEYNAWLKERKAQGAVTVKNNSQGKPTPYVPRSLSAMSRTYMAQIAGEDGNRPLDGADGNALRYSQFSEWLADNIGKVLESNAKSQSVIGKLFESIANAFRTVFAELTGNPELKKYIAAKSVQEWVESLMAPMDTEVEADPATDTAATTDPVTPEGMETPDDGPVAIYQGQVALMPGMDYAPNLLVGSFDPAPNPKSRLTKMEDPLTEILEELNDSAKVEELAGKKVTKEKIDATKKYLLDHVRGLVLQTTGRISTFLASKSKSGTMGHWIAQAALGQVPVGHPDRAKAFQLQPNGKGAIIGLLDHAIDHQGASTTVVNYKLVSSAALAAGQWYLTSGNTGSKKLDEGSVATITGLPVELVTETLRNVVSQGMSYLDAIRGISDNIMQAWNLRMKDDVSIAQAEAVINSMAAELFATMVHGEKDAGALTQKFFDRIDIYVDDGGQVVGTFTNQDRPRKIPEGQKLITRYVPIKQSVNEASISTVLPTLLGVPVDDVIYFDPKDIDVSRTQQHSSVPLSPAERKAQERQQKTGFTMNLPFMKVFNLFSDKNMVDMLGEAVDDNMNISTRESAEGKNVTVLGGVKQIRTVSERITAEAEARGVEPDQVPVYYRFESISTARSMMRGRYNPQSDKGMRQAMTSMKSTADLTNPDHETLWNTAALQMMGERVYAMKPSDITPWANWVFSEPEMVAAIDAIAAALQDSESVTGDTLVPLIQAAATKAKDGLTNELIHVLVDRARYKLATPEQRKAFESRLYIEADGVANGPAGAVAMLSSLKNSMEMTRFIHRAAKTGFFIGQPNMNMNTFRTSGLPGSGVDTYAAAGEHASDWAGQRLLERAQQLANPAMDPDDRKALQKIDTQHKTVLDVMQTLLGAGNFEVITDPDTGIVSLKIARSVTKGPVTITVYGSGKKGIGTKLAGALMEELSARITTSLKNGTPLADQFGGPDNFKLFMAQMYTLTRNVPGYRDGKLAYVWNPDYKADKAGSLPRALGNLNVAARLKDFRLTGKEFASLAQNITEFYVEDLNKGIHSSLGSSVINNSTLMVQASNWQSLAAIHVYNTEIQKLIVSKVAADPNWDYVLQGFSKNDLKELRTKLKTVAPMLRTAMQAWDTTTSGRTPTEHQAGSTISGRFPVQHVARTPDMSGVKVAPYLVIGMGDAAMVTNLMNALDFPEGGMQVYDGINLPFMEAREGGVAANRAIADAWLTNNPLKTLATSFEAVANSVNWDKVITEYARRDPKKAELLESVPHPDEVLARLNEAAARVDALHATIKELGYSMDQMAATGATHSVEGTATGIEGDALEVLFTTTFEKHLGTKTNPEETDSLIADWPVNLDGTKVFNYADTFRLAGLDTVTAQDREIIRNVLRTHKDRLANLSVVMASNTSDLSAYLTPAQAARLKAGTTKGYWIEDSKTLILRDDVGGDTLAHELTHAATFQILRQFFENGLPDTKWGNAVDVSILAVTKLLYDYVDNGGKSRQLSHHASQKFAAFKAEIENILHTPESEPGATVAELWSGASQAQKAQAIAEFIAHVTTDKTLRSVAKSTLVSRIKDSVIRFLKLVVLGPLGMSNKVISNDVLSQLEFHTEVISAAQADMSRRGLSDLIMGTPDPLAQVSLQDSAANEIAAAFRGRIGRYLVSTPQVFDQIGRTIEAKEAATTAGNVVVNAAAAGFLKTPAQRTAFVQIVATMSTLAKLSPAAIQAANRLYSESLDGLEGKLTPEQQDFIRGRTGLEVDAHDRSTLVPAFVGLGLVDPDFRAKLREVEVAGKAKVKGNVDERLQTIGNNALLSLQNMLSGVKRSKNVDDALAGLAEQVARQTALENGIVARAESMTFGAMGKANDWVVNHLSSKSKALSDKAAKVSNASKSKVVKTAATTTSVIANVFNDAGVQANSEAMLSIVNRGKSDILRSLVKDLTGRTESNAQVYDLIKRVGQGVSKARQFYREQLPSVVAKTFTNLPTDEQNKAVFKGIAKSDIASLVQNGDMTAALNTALDDKARAAEIARIEKELQKLTPRTEGRIRKKAKLLADFMNGTVKGGLLRNAEAVANLIDDNVSGLNAPGVQPQTQEVVDLVDKLISLYAVESMDKTELSTLKDLYKAESEGVESILGVLHSQLERDKARRTGRARFNAMKGYIPSEGEGSLVVRDMREDMLLRQMGYTKVADYKGTSLFKTSNMAYYYTPLGKAPFNQGIIQNARITAGGVDQTTGFAVGFPTAGRITQKTTVDRLAKNAHLDSAKEPLIAVFDENGKLVAFERSIDPEQLERLNPSTNTLAMLGQWMGRQAEEDMAQAVNFDAVAKVHDMWANGKHRAGEFVNVLDESAFKNNPVLQDALRLLPNDVKEHAQSLFGTGKFMVRTDMLNDVFGYRDASIGDAWTGNSHWSPETQERVRKLAERYLGQDAMRILVQGESRIKNLVKDAKTLIVVKSVIVPTANFIANIFQMLAQNIPLSAIARGLRDKTLEADFYTKTRVEQMEIAVKLMAMGNKNPNERQKLEARIQAIEDSWRGLSIWPLIQAGEFGSISDAGISRDEILLSEGKLQAYIEAKTEKLPEGLRRMGKWALITKDTALFQGLQKSMEYGDFLAKAIVYDHSLKKGMTQQDALGVVTDEFVNYDRHPGRFRGYVEDLGLAWFYNYKLRISKIAFRMLRKDPLRVALLAGMGIPGMELPVTENVFTKAIEGSLGFSLGPGMLFNAPGLNPWVAAMQ